MESPGSEPPKARPIDRTSLSDAQKKSFQETVDQAREEETARRQSMPTKLLGWMLIGGFCLEVAGGFTGNHADLGGLLFLFAGIGVLKGSQACLRFTTFFVVQGSVALFVYLISSVVLDYPVEIGDKWSDYRDQSFWTLGVSPAMLMLAEAILAVLAFKHRRIRFWTRTVATCAGIFAVLWLIGLAGSLVDMHENRSTGHRALAEIEAARLLASRHGKHSSPGSFLDWNRTFDPMTRVAAISIETSPGGRSRVYDREPHARGTLSSGRLERYSEWVRLSPGKWGKLELELSLPECP